MKLLFSYFSLMLYLDSIIIIETHPRTISAIQKQVDLAFLGTMYKFRLQSCVADENDLELELCEATIRLQKYSIRVKKTGDFHNEKIIRDVLRDALTDEFGYYYLSITYCSNVAASNLGLIGEEFPLYRDAEKNTFADVFRIAKLLLAFLHKLRLRNFTFWGKFRKSNFSIRRGKGRGRKVKVEYIILISLSNLERVSPEEIIAAHELDALQFVVVISDLANHATIKLPWYKMYLYCTKQFKQSVATKRTEFQEQLNIIEGKVRDGADYNALDASLGTLVFVVYS